MVSSYLQGVRYFIKGITLIRHRNLRNYVRIPLLTNIALFGAVSWLSLGWLDRLIDRMLPDWLSFLEYLLWPLFALGFFVFVFYTFTLVINVIMAPFTGLLAERTEGVLIGNTKTAQSSFKQAVADALPTLINESTKLLYFVLRAIPLLILFFIPGINLAAPFIWFIFSAWMLSVEYLDIPASNHSIKFKDIREIIRQRRSLCLGFGTAATVFTMIPIVNFMVVPCAVCGATALWVDIQASSASSIEELK